jgi:hypothetical protein
LSVEGRRGCLLLLLLLLLLIPLLMLVPLLMLELMSYF